MRCELKVIKAKVVLKSLLRIEVCTILVQLLEVTSGAWGVIYNNLEYERDLYTLMAIMEFIHPPRHWC